MALRVQTEISGDVFILRCDGRLGFEDDCAVLRERAGTMLSATAKLVAHLQGVEYIASAGVRTHVGPFASAKTRGVRLT